MCEFRGKTGDMAKAELFLSIMHSNCESDEIKAIFEEARSGSVLGAAHLDFFEKEAIGLGEIYRKPINQNSLASMADFRDKLMIVCGLSEKEEFMNPRDTDYGAYDD